MKRYVPVLLTLLSVILMLLSYDPDYPTQTVQGTISDRAMDSGMAYIGIQPDQGEGLCVYFERESLLPEDLAIGHRVEVTYEIIPLEHGRRYMAVEVRKLG